MSPEYCEWRYGDPHVHSTWSDGLVSIRSQAVWARRHGLGYLVMTDHTDGLEGRWREYVEECQRVSDEVGIPVVPSAEITAVTPRAGKRVLGDCIFHGADPLGPMPPSNQTYEHAKLLGLTCEYPGAFAVVAHPASRRKGWMDLSLPGVGGLELVANARSAPASSLNAWFKLLDGAVSSGGRPAVALGGSDSHAPLWRPGTRGGTWLRLGPEPGWEEIVDALRRGRAVASGRRDLAWLEIDAAGPGDVVTSRIAHRVRVKVLDRPDRRCIFLRVYGAGGRVLVESPHPVDGQQIDVSFGDSGYAVCRFEFSDRCGRRRAESWTNPVFIQRGKG